MRNEFKMELKKQNLSVKLLHKSTINSKKNCFFCFWKDTKDNYPHTNNWKQLTFLMSMYLNTCFLLKMRNEFKMELKEQNLSVKLLHRSTINPKKNCFFCFWKDTKNNYTHTSNWKALTILMSMHLNTYLYNANAQQVQVEAMETKFTSETASQMNNQIIGEKLNIIYRILTCDKAFICQNVEDNHMQKMKLTSLGKVT